MRIDIWSDIACPWCYLGKRRLETALTAVAARTGSSAEDVEVVYRSFQLDPSAPTVATETAQQMLTRRYAMTQEQAAQAQAQVTALAAAEGMTWQHDKTVHANTFDAHRLLHLAAELGCQAELTEALMRANFSEGRNLADHDVLREIAVTAGLPADRVVDVLTGDAYADAVRADIAQAAAYGATGVPFFVFDGRYGVSGAQSVEVFEQVLGQVLAEAG